MAAESLGTLERKRASARWRRRACSTRGPLPGSREQTSGREPLACLRAAQQGADQRIHARSHPRATRVAHAPKQAARRMPASAASKQISKYLSWSGVRCPYLFIVRRMPASAASRSPAAASPRRRHESVQAPLEQRPPPARHAGQSRQEPWPPDPRRPTATRLRVAAPAAPGQLKSPPSAHAGLLGAGGVPRAVASPALYCAPSQRRGRQLHRPAWRGAGSRLSETAPPPRARR